VEGKGMIVDPMYWKWDSILPESVCQAIIDEGMKLPMDEAIVGYHEEKRTDESIRKSKTSWFPSDSWVCGLTSHYVNLANKQAWNYELVGCEEAQFTVYEPGGFYEFHEDSARVGDNDYRKLSIVITITDPNDYEEGYFEFENNTRPDTRARGSIIVFPSFIKHRVVPVTKGTRYSLVNWFHGPRFR
jgi:PKHD-type hydroxylase